jgi:sodium/hydrogen exchanger-like protein 6/7
MMSSLALLVAFSSISAFFFTSHFISQQPKLRWIPESAVIIMFGLLTILATGLVTQTGYISTFNTELFFKILLPPIIFASGFKVDLEIFYQNISTILVFANIGTIINTLVFGAAIFAVGKYNLTTGLSLTESMSFGSVISATDPVTTIAIFDHLQVEPALYVIVVGVSILDDAVSIIMFELFNSIMSEGSKHSISYYIAASTIQFITIFAGSVAVGCAVGLLFAAALKQCKGILCSST